MTTRLLEALFVMAFITITTFPSYASTKTLIVTHTYMMGDNDSRNDARRLCLLEAKRKLMEEAGSFIQSSSEVKDLQLTRDQITSYSAAIFRLETTQETVDLRGGQNALTLMVKAEIDTDEVTKRLTTIAKDTTLQKQIDEQHEKLQRQEEAIKRLTAQLAIASPDRTRGLLEERNGVFADIDEIGQVHLVAKRRIQAESRVECGIANKMKLYVLKGMTQTEVLKILGEPFKKSSGAENSWYYGDSFLEFDDPKGIAEQVKAQETAMINLYGSIGKIRPSIENQNLRTEFIQDAYKVGCCWFG